MGRKEKEGVRQDGERKGNEKNEKKGCFVEYGGNRKRQKGETKL